MRIYAVLLLVVAGLSGQTHNPHKSELYSSKDCAMRFEVPTGWSVERQSPDGVTDKREICTVRVRPRDFVELVKQHDNVDFYTIEVSTTEQDFDSAAAAGNFERRSKAWVVLGRTGMESPAAEISSLKWVGLKGIASVGCYYQDDRGYAGLCEIPRAVLNNRAGTSAILYGSPQSGTQFDAVVKSFEFLR